MVCDASITSKLQEKGLFYRSVWPGLYAGGTNRASYVSLARCVIGSL